MATKMRTLVCHFDGHTFTRPAQTGRLPMFCDEHRRYGTAPRKLTTAETTKETTKQEPPKVKTETHSGEHYAFRKLLAFFRAGSHVYGFGPSGSGKTEGARRAAEAMGVPFIEEPCNRLMNKDDLLGFNGPHGYVSGVVREWLEHRDGAVLLLDEMDASNESLLIAINLAAALNVGQSMRFPDGARLIRTERHVIMGAGNTNANGATDAYKGRTALDAATMNRFAFLPWGYDEALERFLVATDAIGAEWVTFCQRVRKIAEEISLRLLITPRNSMNGADELRRGELSREDVEEARIWQGCDEDTRRTVKTLLRSAAAA